MVMRHALYLPLVVSLLLPGLQAIAAEEPRPEQVQSDISTREISIESNFTGIEIVLFGSVAAAGIRTLSRVNFTNSNVLIVAVSIGVGIIPITVPEVYNHLPEWLATIFESGISATAIFAVLLNLAFNHFSKTDEPVAAEH